VLAGEAGIGKTRLVQEFSERAFAQGARVLTGACVDVGDPALPYGAIVDALRTVPRDAFDGLPARLRRELATLVPEAAPDEDGHDGTQSGLFGAVLRLLEQLGCDGPVVLVLEDLHWADGSTEALVRFLLRGLHQSAVLLVLTYRTDELERDHPVRRLLAELGRAPRVRTLAPAPLTRAQTAVQLAALAGRPVDDATVAAIHVRSEGNPFYSEELLAAADAAGPVPATLRDTLLTRIDRLPPGAQHVARIAAACGRHVDHDLLAAICGLGDDALDDALRACVTGHVLAVDHERRGYRFRHALLQEVALAELLPGERSRTDERIADVLCARPPGVGVAGAQRLAEIAFHRLRASDPAAGLSAAVRAARAAEAVHALTVASHSYDAALELWDDVEDPEAATGVDLPFLLERAATCRWLGFGEADISASLRERAAAELDASASRLRRTDHLSRQATTWCNADLRAGVPVHEEALSLLDATPSETAARVRGRYACALMLMGDFAAAERHAIEAAEVARAVGARDEAADALITCAVCRATAGDADAATALLEQARPAALESRDLRVMQRWFTNASHISMSFARYEEALAIAIEGIATHPRAGLDLPGQIGVRENAAGALCALGRPAEAAEVIGEDPGSLSAKTIILELRLAQAALLQGDVDGAADRLARARAVPGVESFVLVPTCALHVEASLWREDMAGALEAALAGEAVVVEADRLETAALLAVAVRAQVDAAGAGAVDPASAQAEADRLVARLARVARPGSAPLPDVDQLLRVAEAERSRLHDLPDPAPWRAVVAGWAGLGRPYEAGYAQWRLAEALAAARGERDELERVLGAAHAAATRVGADHLAAAVERLARRARVALPGTTTGEGAFPDLTRREREVLELVADGRTNRQIAATLFISEKTASHHVSNILGKLGAANRGEAAALAHRAGVDGAGETETEAEAAVAAESR
jgi:DNA-binding CsgD family transcriptional regulator